MTVRNEDRPDTCCTRKKEPRDLEFAGQFSF